VSRLSLEPFAALLDWQLDEAATPVAWQTLFSRFLECLAQESAREENTVIGHIKALAKLPEQGFIQTSVVSASRPATGEIVDATQGRYDNLTLTLNFLVYGLPFQKAERIVRQAGESIAKETGGSIQMRDVSDPSHTSHHHDA
jgi:hypothetical protein